MGEIAMRTLRSFRKLVTPACLLGIAVPTLALAQSATTAPPAQQVRFAGAIQEFLDNDKTSPPPEEGILFIGSNIFCQWSTVVEDMAPLPVFNRAFGGSRTWEVNAHMDRIVLPYKPRIIVYYCGSNDVNAYESADAIFGRFRQFQIRVARALPDTRVFFFAINRGVNPRGWTVGVGWIDRLRVSGCIHTLEFLRRPVAEGGVQASSIVYLLKEVGESVG